MDFDHLSRQLARQAMRRLQKSQGIVDKQNTRAKRRLAKDATSK